MKRSVRLMLAAVICALFGLILMAVSHADDAPVTRLLYSWRVADRAVRLPETELSQVESSSPQKSSMISQPPPQQAIKTAWLTGQIIPAEKQRPKTPVAKQDQGPQILEWPPKGIVSRLPYPKAEPQIEVIQHSDRHIAKVILESFQPPSNELVTIPPNYIPWWQNGVGQSLRKSVQPLTINVETLVIEALRHSPRIQAISEQPLIGETKIIEAKAEFDITTFMESKYSRNSEPVGSTLTTGGPLRLREKNWTYQGGLRKKSSLGGSLELSQTIGTEESNSDFFLPAQQGNSKLSISFTQPLLYGAGSVYNKSLILLAKIETDIAWDQTSRNLQNQLMEINEAYWELYMQRALLLQRQRLLQRAEEIFSELESRRGIDTLASQIASVGAAVATRRAELIRTRASIQNGETRIRALINSAQLSTNDSHELIPFESPAMVFIEISSRDALLSAMQNRPEVDEAMKQIHAANVRVKMAKNELLPILDAVLETYVLGLEGNNDIGKALGDQFSQGEPGYTIGFQFEVPIHMRAARARHNRRKLELRQLTQQFRATVAILSAEAEIAVREVNTSYREMQANYSAMHAAQAELQYLQQRWRLLPGEDRSASFLLEDLLNAQERLAAEELGFSQAQIAYTISLTKLKQATGTLLKNEQISVHHVHDGNLPKLIYHKSQFIQQAPVQSRTPAASSAPSEADDNIRYPLPTP